MHRITINHHGCKVGTAPRISPHDKTLRSAVSGWSAGAARRNIDFLWSIEPNTLHGLGMAFTGTLKHCPPSSDDWHRILNSFFRRLRRMGLIRLHWVTEWQKRGVPHIHCALWFPDSDDVSKIATDVRDHWLSLTAEYGSTPFAQHMTLIHDSVGWFQYVSKHQARGVRHYQRSPENIPEEWKKKTGRVWGKIGDWVTREAMRLSVPADVYHQFRRMCRSWRIADARRAKCRRRIKSARRMLQCNKRGLSTVRGAAEWIPMETQLKMLACAASNSQCPEDILHL